MGESVILSCHVLLILNSPYVAPARPWEQRSAAATKKETAVVAVRGGDLKRRAAAETGGVVRMKPMRSPGHTAAKLF